MLFCPACEVFIPDEDAIQAGLSYELCPYCEEALENVAEEA